MENEVTLLKEQRTATYVRWTDAYVPQSKQRCAIRTHTLPVNTGKTCSSRFFAGKFYIEFRIFAGGWRILTTGYQNATRIHVASSASVRSSKMINSVLERIFGCSHRRTTFPITPKRSSARVGAYVTCLDCGKEFAYNWNDMRQEEQLTTAAPVPPPTRLVRPNEGLSRLVRFGN